MQKHIRRIPFENAYNFRDLGGYPTTDGKSTVWGKLYRSDSLSSLSDSDLLLLEQLEVKTVIDLRSKTEAVALKDILPTSVKYYHCPVQDFEVNPDGSPITTFEHTLAESYEKFLTKTGERFCKALNILTDRLSEGAVVFHCSAGKDRTGSMTATILRLLNVSFEDIAADYQVSGTYNTNGLNTSSTSLAKTGNIALKIDSNPANLEVLFDFFRKANLEQHLINNGFLPENINKLKSFMLE